MTLLRWSFVALVVIGALWVTPSWSRTAKCASDGDCRHLRTGSCEAGICVQSPCSEVTCRPGTFCIAKSGRAACIDPCASSPCKNGGACSGKDARTTVCQCTPDYGGERCETPIDPCATSPCGEGSFCVANGDSASCVNPCDPNPCENGAACTAEGAQTATCTCAVGWTGALCSVNINECQHSPCLNGGTCVDMIAGYECNCAQGWQGTDCEAQQQ